MPSSSARSCPPMPYCSALEGIYRACFKCLCTPMAPQHTPQGLRSSTFCPAPFRHGLSVPGLYEYHANHSPDHPVFTYSDDSEGFSKDITCSAAWSRIGVVAELILTRYNESSKRNGERSVIAILAHAGQYILYQMCDAFVDCWSS